MAVESNLLTAIIGGVSGGTAFVLIVSIVVFCIFIVASMQQKLHKTRKYEVNNRDIDLDNRRPTNPEVEECNSSLIVDVNVGIPSHCQPQQYPHHGGMLLLQEDTNLSYGVDACSTDDENISSAAEEEAESTLSNLPTNFDRSMPHFGRLMCQDSNPSKRAESTKTSSDAFTVNSDPVTVFHNLPGNYSQISAATNSSSSSVDVAYRLLQANISGRK